MNKSLHFFLLMWIVPTLMGMAQIENQPLCTEKSNPIMVHVHGVRNDQGTIKVKLYGNNPEEFLVTGKKLDSPRLPARKDRTLVCVYAPHPGSYALVVHHDENGNKKLDRNWVGFPTEGYGFSNNPKLVLGPPSHHEVSFETQEGITHIHVDLKY